MDFENLPVYDLLIADDTQSDEEVDFVSLVDRPAIMRNFLAFQEGDFVDPRAGESESDFIGRCIGTLVGEEGYDQDQATAVCYSKWEKTRQMIGQFAIQDEEQRIISGPLILADRKIYRKEGKREYYVVFPKETVKAIALKFFKKGYQANVNLMHDGGQTVDGVTMFESWIKDDARGIPGMKGYEDVPDGSWFGSFKVENDAVWAKIKAGEVKGFSVEGIFQYKQASRPVEEVMMDQIIEILDQVGQ